MNCLLLSPRFHSESFWAMTQICKIMGVEYTFPPLGLITVASLLPKEWKIRLVDRNIETLKDSELNWADLVFVGGMIPQRKDMLNLISYLKAKNKRVAVGGPDASTFPELYHEADWIFIGEAEAILSDFLRDLGDNPKSGKTQKIYNATGQSADMSKAPLPRFDLIKKNKYLASTIQVGRGCPFQCEFCDIIVLFGRVPRIKTPDKVILELESLYRLGFRGHVFISDDNFIGNRKVIRDLLEKLLVWQKAKGYPFWFNTQATINLADDDKTLSLMRDCGFQDIFIGIESPNSDLLLEMNKKQNLRRSLEQSVHKIQSYGICVSAGFIVGFDAETRSISKDIIDLIQGASIPTAMVGLLYAFQGTALEKRLTKEGRFLSDTSDEPSCQTVDGLNFKTIRPKNEILEDMSSVIKGIYNPEKFFERVKDLCLRLDLSKSPNFRDKNLSFIQRIGFLIYFCVTNIRFGKFKYLFHFWKAYRSVKAGNQRALLLFFRNSFTLFHLGPFSDLLLTKLKKKILTSSSPEGFGRGMAQTQVSAFRI